MIQEKTHDLIYYINNEIMNNYQFDVYGTPLHDITVKFPVPWLDNNTDDQQRRMKEWNSYANVKAFNNLLVKNIDEKNGEKKIDDIINYIKSFILRHHHMPYTLDKLDSYIFAKNIREIVNEQTYEDFWQNYDNRKTHNENVYGDQRDPPCIIL